MIKFTSIVTVAVWAAVLVWFGSALLAGQLHQPSGDFLCQLTAVLCACCVIVLTWRASGRRSLGASRWLVGISVLAALWAGLAAWVIVSPITIVGLELFTGFTFFAWLSLVVLLIMFITPWLWAVVCLQLRKQSTQKT